MLDEQLKDEAGRLAALQRYGIPDTGVDEPFSHIVTLVRAALGVPMAAVSLIDADRQNFKAASGMSDEPTRRDTSFCTHTIQHRGPTNVPDATLDERFATNPNVTGEMNLRSYLGVPLETPDGYNIGSLCAIDTTPRRFSDAQVALMEGLAKLVVEQMELRQIARTDYLTGALTRRGFMHEVDREFARASRYNRPSALIFLDLDHFKKVNDTFGHPAGDQVLQRVAQICRDTLRQSDAFGRLGGEEFGILLPETSPEDAMLCAERLRQLVEAAEVETGAGRVSATISCGVASLTSELGTAAMWFASTDVALYQAKRTGRNRCVSGDPGVLAPPPKPGFTEKLARAVRLH